MGKLLLWLKSLGVGNLPVVASVSLGLQVGASNIQQSKIETVERSVVKKVEIQRNKIEHKSLITINEEGEFEFAGEALQDLEEPLTLIRDVEAPNVSASVPVVAASRAVSPQPAARSQVGSRAPSNDNRSFLRTNSTNVKISPALILEYEKLNKLSSTLKPTTPTGIVTASKVEKDKVPASKNVNDSTSQGLGGSNSISDGGEALAPNSPTQETLSIDKTFLGNALDETFVSTETTVTAESDKLYIAAVSYEGDDESVLSVNGLGLTWNLLEVQCSNHGKIQMEIWYAHGIVDVDSVVTANLSSDLSSSNIIVSNFNGVDLSQPFAGSTKANFNGVGAAANCGPVGAQVLSYSYSADTLESDTLLFTATSFTADQVHSAGTMTEVLESNSGGPSGLATNLSVNTLETPSSSTYSVEGSFSGNVRWSSISLELRKQP